MADPLIPTQRPAFMGEWTFNNTTTPPPATSQLRLNDGGQNKATAIFVNNISFNGVNAASWLMEMIPGCSIRIQDKVDATKWQSYAITGEPVANTGYVELKTTWLAGGPNVASGQNIMLSFIAVAVRVTSNAMTVHGGSPVASIPVRVAVQSPGVMQVSPGMVNAAGLIQLPGQAFPSNTPAGFSPGMTLRQYYAAQAMMGFISATPPAGNLVGRLSEFAFTVADSMIAYEVREAEGYRPPLVGTNRNLPLPLPGAQPQQLAGMRKAGKAAPPPPQPSAKVVFPRKIIS